MKDIAARMGRSERPVRFETEPGRQLQHDWAQLKTWIAGHLARVHFAVNTPGCSRRFHVFAGPREDAEHTHESLVRALEHFCGVTTGEVLVDNQKSAVLGRKQDRYALTSGSWTWSNAAETTRPGCARLPVLSPAWFRRTGLLSPFVPDLEVRLSRQRQATIGGLDGDDKLSYCYDNLSYIP